MRVTMTAMMMRRSSPTPDQSSPALQPLTYQSLGNDPELHSDVTLTLTRSKIFIGYL